MGNKNTTKYVEVEVSLKARSKRAAIALLIGFNVALAGAVTGAWEMHQMDSGNASQTQKAVLSALHANTAQAASPKADSR